MTDLALRDTDAVVHVRQPTLVFEDNDVRIAEVRSSSPDAEVVIAFPGITQKMGMPVEEFVGSATAGGRSALFVTDKMCSWYNYPGLYERILDHLAPRLAGARRIITVGNSMGAFGALLFAAPLGARAAIAFAPRVSASPKVVPEDLRRRARLAAMGEQRFENINDFLADGIRYYVMHPAEGPDALHGRAFRARDGLHRFVFPGEEHGIGRKIKEAGALSDLFDAAMERDDGAVTQIVSAAGGVEARQVSAATV